MRRRPGPAPDLAAWRASLVGGVVVAGAVWGLLEALRRAAVDVDEAVEDVWTAGKRLAQNTQATHLLTETRDGGVALLAELERHRDLMEGPPT
jgi:hypothetical protein